MSNDDDPIVTQCATCDHDCAAEGCEGVARRVHVECIAQGLPHIGHPTGDPDYDARLARAYRDTATIMGSAAFSPEAGRSRPLRENRGGGR